MWHSPTHPPGSLCVDRDTFSSASNRTDGHTHRLRTNRTPGGPMGTPPPHSRCSYCRRRGGTRTGPVCRHRSDGWRHSPRRTQSPCCHSAAGSAQRICWSCVQRGSIGSESSYTSIAHSIPQSLVTHIPFLSPWLPVPLVYVQLTVIAPGQKQVPLPAPGDRIDTPLVAGQSPVRPDTSGNAEPALQLDAGSSGLSSLPASEEFDWLETHAV